MEQISFSGLFRTFRTIPDFSENADPAAGFARNVIKSKDRDDTGLLKPRESLERRFPYASEDPLRNACEVELLIEHKPGFRNVTMKPFFGFIDLGVVRCVFSEFAFIDFEDARRSFSSFEFIDFLRRKLVYRLYRFYRLHRFSLSISSIL